MAETAKGAPKGALRTITLGNLMQHPFPPRADIVRPWLRSGESAMLWAPSGIGKTMLGLTIALAVAGGGTVLGWSAPEARRVLYIDGEMHAQDLKDRLEMLAPTVDGLDMGAASRNLVLLSRQFQDGAVLFPDLGEREAPPDGKRRAGQERAIAEIARSFAEFVVLDNVSTLIEVSDENDAAAVTPVLSFLLRLKQMDVAALVIHHSGKAGDTYRGSSKLATTFEVIVGLRALDGRSALDGAGFELRWDKYRGKPSVATQDAEVILQGSEGSLRWQSKPAPGTEVAQFMAALKSCQHPTQASIAAALGWDGAKTTRVKQLAIRRDLTNRAEVEEYLSAASANAIEGAQAADF